MRKEMLNLKNMRPINREIAGQVATLASRFDCTFVMEFANSIVNMKSMLGLLSQMLPMSAPNRGRRRKRSHGRHAEAAEGIRKIKRRFRPPFPAKKWPAGRRGCAAFFAQNPVDNFSEKMWERFPNPLPQKEKDFP